MYSLWLLLAMVLAAPLYYVWQIRRFGRRELRESIPSISEPPTHPGILLKSTGVQTRMMKWISIGEFMAVLTKCSDLIVIDLRADAPWVPFSVPTAFVLRVTPNELVKVLECLPADRTVAFCGASNLCIFMIETSQCMEGSAPLYVLEGDLDLAEVA
jgi:hypothetical protein